MTIPALAIQSMHDIGFEFDTKNSVMGNIIFKDERGDKYIYNTYNEVLNWILMQELPIEYVDIQEYILSELKIIDSEKYPK